MSPDDDAPILGVAPADVEASVGPEDLEWAPPEPAEDLAPVVLDRQGRKVIERTLRVEGEIVRSLRGVPAAEPDAWRWTDEEIAALMPAFEGLAERYGVAERINEHAPQAGAALAIAMHANRSLAAERAWAAAHTDQTDQEPPHEPEPAPGPEPVVGAEPAPAQPGAGGGAVDLTRVADHLGPPGVRGGAG